MKTEKQYNEAIKLIRRLIAKYPYVAEECQNNEGKPCRKCQAIIDAREFIKRK